VETTELISLKYTATTAAEFEFNSPLEVRRDSRATAN